MTQGAWLLEWLGNDNTPTRWWSPDKGWMIDPHKACWFAREQDASAYKASSKMHGVVKPTQHIFGLQTPPPPAVGEAEGLATKPRCGLASGPAETWQQAAEHFQSRAETAERELDEARLIARMGCDANAGGEHTLMTDGRYQFCSACGETVTKEAAHLRGRIATLTSERDALKAENERLRDKHQDDVSHGYKAWPDAEDIPDDLGCIIDLIAEERDAALALLGEAAEIMKPFELALFWADMAADGGSSHDHNEVDEAGKLTVGALRRATAFANSIRKGKGE